MSLKLTLGAGFVLLLVSFAVVSAQDTGTPSSIYCPHLTVNLQYGSRDATTGGQVTELQKFLSEYYDLDPVEYVTGFFGRKTRDNVRKFQCEKLSICSGDESTTGWGFVGPKTRNAIAQNCGTNTPPPQNNLSCTTPWGTTIENNTSITAYQSADVLQESQCVSEQRVCINGTLTGSYRYAACRWSGTTTSCTPENPQTQTLSCPTGQTGAITQTRTSTCPGPTWGPWTTTSNTCITPANTTQACLLDGVTILHTQSRAFYSARTSTNCSSIAQTRTCTNGTLDGTSSYQYATCTTQQAANPNVGACTYRGQSYAEGNTISFQISPVGNPQTLTCDNEVWVTNASYVGISAGLNVCDYKSSLGYTSDWSNLCANQPSKPHFAVVPRHGKPPLTVTTTRLPGGNGSQCSYSISWGDGSTDSEPSHSCNNVPENGPQINSHTYASPGSYTIQFQATGSWAYTTGSNSANIRVDPAGTASIQNSSQLANALTALESALQAILEMLQ